MTSLWDTILHIHGPGAETLVYGTDQVQSTVAIRILDQMLSRIRNLWSMAEVADVIRLILLCLGLREREPLRRVCRGWNEIIRCIPHDMTIPVRSSCAHLGTRYGILEFLSCCATQEQFDTLLDKALLNANFSTIQLSPIRGDCFVTPENIHKIYMLISSKPHLLGYWATMLPDMSVLHDFTGWKPNAWHIAECIVQNPGTNIPVRNIHYLHNRRLLDELIESVISKRMSRVPRRYRTGMHPLTHLQNSSWSLFVYVAHFYPKKKYADFPDKIGNLRFPDETERKALLLLSAFRESFRTLDEYHIPDLAVALETCGRYLHI